MPLLRDLPKHVEHFTFILGVQKRQFRDQRQDQGVKMIRVLVDAEKKLIISVLPPVFRAELNRRAEKQTGLAVALVVIVSIGAAATPLFTGLL